jgi:hypothetical protein
MILFFKVFLSLAFACDEQFAANLVEFQTLISTGLFYDTKSRMEVFSEGSEAVCFSAAGTYRFTKGDETHEYEFLNLDPEYLTKFSDPFFKLAYEVNVDGKSNGLLILTAKGWVMVEPVNKEEYLTLKEPMIDRARMAVRGFVEREKNPAFKINFVKFSPDMLTGAAPGGGVFTYDSQGTIDRFVASHSKTNYSAYLNNRTLRIPPKMYEILDDPAFRRAHAEKKYTAALDIIYRKALEVSNGDKFKAKFISLLITDVRQRGPCGAIRGKRGKSIVPQSIFDGEVGSILYPNRLDATQHFFGYALMRDLTGGDLSPAVSYLGKKNQYYFPKISNLFDNFHIGSNVGGDTDGDGSRRFFSSIYKAKERLKIDVERDMFYNDLGMDFGSRDVLPSEVINEPKLTDRKRNLGLRAPNVPEWQAYDPYKEAPRKVSLPPEKRDREKLRNLSYYWDIPTTGVICENSYEEDMRRRACDLHNRLIKKEVDDFYERNIRHTELRQGK